MAITENGGSANAALGEKSRPEADVGNGSADYDATFREIDPVYEAKAHVLNRAVCDHTLHSRRLRRTRQLD